MGQMKSPLSIRIKRIEFKNFRNIDYGAVDFSNTNFKDFIEDEKPSILGIYGQNGSGKTSVVMAIDILKQIISEKPLTDAYMSCVKEGHESCTLSFVINVFNGDCNDNQIMNIDENHYCEIQYSFDIAKTKEKNKEMFDFVENKQEYKLHICNEIFKYRLIDKDEQKVMSTQTFIDTSKNIGNTFNIFGSEQKRKIYIGSNQELVQRMIEIKAVAYANSTSFVFSKEFIEIMIESSSKYMMSLFESINNENVEKTIESVKYNQLPLFIISKLTYTPFMQIINTSATGMTNLNDNMPLYIYGLFEDGGGYSGLFPINMKGPTSLQKTSFEYVEHSIKSLSIVLEKIIPDLKIKIVKLKSSLSNNVEQNIDFELVAERNKISIPLKYESDGVRRLISILSLLIAVYNNKSFIVAVDEIDSGIFEYLLGEIISIISESAKGQIIFTSHNLRPLEVLPPKYLCFTTTNASNRFTTLSKRGNSNLRDSYFRTIELDTKDHPIYNPTDRYEIEMAFYKAGHREAKYGK